MAATLSLVRRPDYAQPISDISSISLLSFTNGINVDYYDAWPQAVPGGMERGDVFETMRLHIRGTSHDTLAAYVQALDQKVKEAAWYWDATRERYGVWLRAQLTGETYKRQSLIRRMSGQVGESILAPYTDTGYVMRNYTLGIERLPWWEGTDISALTTPSTLAVNGGMATIEQTIVGDVPARPVSTTVLVSAGDELDECWFGFRTARFGTANNFVPEWPTGSGHTVSADTTDEGTWMSCDFTASEDMTTRFYVKVEDVAAANPTDQRGEFIVLLRAKLSAGGTTCYVRLLDGYSSTDSNLRRQGRVKVDSTDWMLYALGTVSIPGEGIPGWSLFTTYRLTMQAERTAGASNLYFDYFLLIPIAEGGLHISGMAMTAGEQVHTYVRPDGITIGTTYAAGGMDDVQEIITPGPMGPYGYSIPVGTVNIVFAGQRATAHDETDTVTWGCDALERWRTLRGSEVTS